MIVLGVAGGFSVGSQDPSAVLMRNGQVVAAISEERLCGEKFARGRMPTRAIRAVLDHAELTINDVDVLATSWVTYPDFGRRLDEYFRFAFGHCPPTKRYDHHACHAASAYFPSGSQDSKILTCDLSGDNISTAIWHGRGDHLEQLTAIERPNSLGVFYSLITQYLGFDRDADEYKVMGLAACGQPTMDLSWLLRSTATGYELDRTFTRYLEHDDTGTRDEPLFNETALAQRLGFPPRHRDPLEAQHIELAASAQAALEDVVWRLLEPFVKPGEHLCLAGGVALNCSLNGKLLSGGRFDHVYVPPAAGDEGLALGAAYLAAVDFGESPQPLTNAFLGPSYDSNTVRHWLDVLQMPYRQTDNAPREAAELLAGGKIVGWFQGRMEFGPRALGARSILADPRSAETKDQLNLRVKFREDFRPFAPAVLAEDAATYFECPQASPYMTAAVRATVEGARCLPAAVHADGTARVQTVEADDVPKFHALISEFKRITDGCSAVINTSLNVAGQPLACSPVDGLRVFSCSGMDAMVIEDFVIEKHAE